MKKVLPLAICTIVAFAAGIALQRCVLSQCSAPAFEGDIDPATVQVRAEWAAPDSGITGGVLVLEQDGKPAQTWPLGRILMEDWPDVPIHYTAVRSSRSWWLAWRSDGDAGAIQHNGAVIWFPQGQAPVFWSGVWKRTESRDGDDPYVYHYRTTVVPTPGRGSGLGLQLRLVGQGLGMEHNHASVFSAAKQQADGSWRFVVDDMNRLHIERMLACETLSGLHDQLREFLPAD